jgi:hypothetical protein
MLLSQYRRDLRPRKLFDKETKLADLSRLPSHKISEESRKFRAEKSAPRDHQPFATSRPLLAGISLLAENDARLGQIVGRKFH